MNKKYDPKFKQETVNLAVNNEQSYRQTANDLGIDYKTFCNWIYQTMNKPTHQAIKSTVNSISNGMSTLFHTNKIRSFILRLYSIGV